MLAQYDIYDSLVAILRSPYDASQVADLIDGHRALLNATAGTAHINVQIEPAMATVGTTMNSIVDVQDVGSTATFSLAGTRMVNALVQCSPSRPQMVQRCVQAAPAQVATRDAAVSGGTTWEELKQKALAMAQARAHEDVLREFEPVLERAVVAAEVQAERAAQMLGKAHVAKCSVRAGFEKQAREAAAALADRRAAAEERAAAVMDRSHNEGVVELLRARVKALEDWSEA